MIFSDKGHGKEHHHSVINLYLSFFKGLQDLSSIKLRIENGLLDHEWLAYIVTMKGVKTPAEQMWPSYVSQVTLQDLEPNKTHLEFYRKMFNITQSANSEDNSAGFRQY